MRLVSVGLWVRVPLSAPNFLGVGQFGSPPDLGSGVVAGSIPVT